LLLLSVPLFTLVSYCIFKLLFSYSATRPQVSNCECQCIDVAGYFSVDKTALQPAACNAEFVKLFGFCDASQSTEFITPDLWLPNNLDLYLGHLQYLTCGQQSIMVAMKHHMCQTGLSRHS